MKRVDMIRKIWESNEDLSWEESERLVKLFFEEIKNALSRDERVELRGLGVFGVRERRGRKGRNPRTGDSVDVRPKRVPYFKVSRRLSKEMNKKGD